MSPESDRAQREASRHWPPAPGTNSRRVMCPLCGSSGYAGERWVLSHTEENHATCEVCGKVCLKSGMANHIRRKHPPDMP